MDSTRKRPRRRGIPAAGVPVVPVGVTPAHAPGRAATSHPNELPPPSGGVTLPPELHALHPNTVVCQITGECLANRGIHDRALLFLDPDLEPTPGCVVGAVAISPAGRPVNWFKVWQTDGAESWLEYDGRGEYAPGRARYRRFVVWGVVWAHGQALRLRRDAHTAPDAPEVFAAPPLRLLPGGRRP